MNRFLKWLEGLSPIDAGAVIVFTMFISAMISMWLIATGHVATVLVIIAVSLGAIVALIVRAVR